MRWVKARQVLTRGACGCSFDCRGWRGRLCRPSSSPLLTAPIPRQLILARLHVLLVPRRIARLFACLPFPLSFLGLLLALPAHSPYSIDLNLRRSLDIRLYLAPQLASKVELRAVWDCILRRSGLSRVEIVRGRGAPSHTQRLRRRLVVAAAAEVAAAHAADICCGRDRVCCGRDRRSPARRSRRHASRHRVRWKRYGLTERFRGLDGRFTRADRGSAGVSIADHIADDIVSRVGDLVGNRIGDLIGDPTRNRIGGCIGGRIGGCICGRIGGCICGRIGGLTGDRIGKRVGSSSAGCTSLHAACDAAALHGFSAGLGR